MLTLSLSLALSLINRQHPVLLIRAARGQHRSVMFGFEEFVSISMLTKFKCRLNEQQSICAGSFFFFFGFLRMDDRLCEMCDLE